MAEERKIKCSSTTTGGGKYGVIKAWLKMRHIEYDEDDFNAGSHFWTELKYQLTEEEFRELLLYLEAAEVLDGIRDVII